MIDSMVAQYSAQAQADAIKARVDAENAALRADATAARAEVIQANARIAELTGIIADQRNEIVAWESKNTTLVIKVASLEAEIRHTAFIDKNPDLVRYSSIIPKATQAEIEAAAARIRSAVDPKRAGSA
jgi:chromosome segregation ATPase